ncbi:YcnI family copper-binding membrane protein [Arthrobacter crystallopoietes]|uniref:YcnI family copper-binding membrane protein n=1 Tax=Crystallibacter crystallopoietes TaxID=37928 RepID=UPI001ABE12D6|nr:YcnI family protein [Arthrobacter crystallopoietes]QTG82237.1 YcnI family protein [Arthrobacter crystallopoietes]
MTTQTTQTTNPARTAGETRTNRRPARTLRTGLAAAATIGLLGFGAAAASAHVHVTPDSTAAGSSSLLTFDFSHGCEAAPTTEIAISLPEQIDDATPTAHPGWDVEKVEETLETPKKLENGTTITKRVSQIVYTAKEPLADGVRDALQIQVQLPAAEGETLAFPVLQTCTEGSTDWAQVAEAGQDSHDLESPAPSFAVTAAEAAGHGHGTAEGAADTEQVSNTSAAGARGTNDGGAATAGWVGLVAGLLGLLAGAAALVRTRGVKK